MPSWGGGGGIMEKQNLKIHTQYFIELKSKNEKKNIWVNKLKNVKHGIHKNVRNNEKKTFLELKSMQENRLYLKKIRF